MLLNDPHEFRQISNFTPPVVVYASLLLILTFQPSLSIKVSTILRTQEITDALTKIKVLMYSKLTIIFLVHILIISIIY